MQRIATDSRGETIARIALVCVAVAFIIAEVFRPTHWQPKTISHASLAAVGKADKLAGVALDDLPPITMVPMGSIDGLAASNAGGQWIPLKPGATVSLASQVRVYGWIAEPENTRAGSGLILIVDGLRRFNVSDSYGSPRRDVVAYYKNPALAPTGFNVVLPASELGAGRHALQLGLISADGSGYFLFPVTQTVQVL